MRLLKKLRNLLKLLQAINLILLFGITTAKASAPHIKTAESEWLQIANLIEEEKRPSLHLTEKNRAVKSWALAFDNDIFVPGGRDQDYTYGINFTQTNKIADEGLLSLNKPLMVLDDFIGNHHHSISMQQTFSREIGAFGFTPENINIETPNPNDRPYASLIYLSSSREQVDLIDNVAWKSTLTLGALGLGAVGSLQNWVHQATGSEKPKGWDNQISDGGELTGRYVIAHQKYLDGLDNGLEVKSTTQASVGYLTEASWSLSFRKGTIHSPWASFNPELASYGEKSSYSSNSQSVNERYFWAGIAVKARGYNAFLQGQFRDSVVNYDHNQLNPLLVEAWAGYTFAFKEGYRISYVLRGHSSEMKEGAGDRNLLWGGLIIARSI